MFAKGLTEELNRRMSERNSAIRTGKSFLNKTTRKESMANVRNWFLLKSGIENIESRN